MACCNTTDPHDLSESKRSRKPLGHPTGSLRILFSGLTATELRRINETSEVLQKRMKEVVKRANQRGCHAHKKWTQCMEDIFKGVDRIGHQQVVRDNNGLYVVETTVNPETGKEHKERKTIREKGKVLHLGNEKFRMHGEMLYLGDKRITRWGLTTYIGTESVHKRRRSWF